MTNVVWNNLFHRELCNLALDVIASESKPVLISTIADLIKRQGASQATAENIIGILIGAYKVPVLRDGTYLKFENGGA